MDFEFHPLPCHTPNPCREIEKGCGSVLGNRPECEVINTTYYTMEGTCNCPILEDCTVYVNDVAHNEMVGLSYRSLYCLQVNKKYKSCKRYMAYLKLGKPAPRYILPNSAINPDGFHD